MADHTSSATTAQAAFALVGEFMFNWAYIENRVVMGIQSLLDLEEPQAEIILANVTFRDKTSMAATLSHVILTEAKLADDATAALKLFDAINKFNSDYRNVLVHNVFLDTADGIEIFRVRAKGKYEVQQTIWDQKFFEARFKEIDAFEIQLDKLFERLKAVSNSADLFRALMIHHGAILPSPTGSFAPPERSNLRPPPPPANTDSPPQPTTQLTDRETPPDRKP